MECVPAAGAQPGERRGGWLEGAGKKGEDEAAGAIGFGQVGLWNEAGTRAEAFAGGLLGDLPSDLRDDGLGLLEAGGAQRGGGGRIGHDEVETAIAPRSLKDLRDASGGRQQEVRRHRSSDPGRTGEGYCAGCHVSTFLRRRLAGSLRRSSETSQANHWRPDEDGPSLTGSVEALFRVVLRG